MASSLRHRLSNLSALRTPPRTTRVEATASPRFFQGHSSGRGGYSTSQEVAPLASRPGLHCLPAADPQAASVLTRSPNVIYPPLSEWLFLDLETTGLAGGTGTYAFLIGLGRLEPGGFGLRQFFLRDLAAEKALLTELASDLCRASVLVSYNGKLFDVPLLETRFRLARLDFDFERFFHLDLLYPARRLWRHRGPVRLAHLEHSLFGHERPADVPGEMIPRIYFDYLRSGDDRPLEGVFRHNAEDLVTLAAITARVLHLVSARGSAPLDPMERYALGRLFERERQLEPARWLYEQALAASLPGDIERAARLRLSYLCKRRRDYPQAIALWKQLLSAKQDKAGGETLELLEELAICYEHRLGDPEGATQVTRQALGQLVAWQGSASHKRSRYRRLHQRFAHRLRRLTAKRRGFFSTGRLSLEHRLDLTAPAE